MPRNNLQEEKPRISNDSSRASFSSSSCSSTFSSLDFNRTIQPETTATTSRSHDLRDVVKESMHREVRSLSIKPHSSGERRGTVMKHIDSPRPLKQSNVANELLTLSRFSYDGRESREANRAAMKMKELPRLSLDSKTNCIKALESRLNQEPSSHNRRSSVVARLMGLEALPDATSIDKRSPPLIRKEALLSELSLTTDDHKQNQEDYSPRVSLKNPLTKQDSWRQQDPRKDSPKMAAKSGKGAADSLHQTSSVYGQITKRITELEFKKSGKDLRALKQILESMEEKTTARTVDQHAELTSRRRCSLEESCPHQNTRDFHQAKLRTPTPKTHSQKSQNLTPKRRNAKTHYQHVFSTDKKSNSELDRALKTTRRMKLEACTTPCRSPAAVSPRLQQNPLRIEAESGRAKMQHGSKKHSEKGSQSRKNRVKAKETEAINLVHSIKTNTRVDKNLVSITREQIPAVGSDATILEQPSPISVLDNTFYSEDPPSPVKKISSPFQEDKSPGPDEAEWRLQNHLIDCTRLNQSLKYNQKLEDMKRSVQELQLNKEPERTASNHNKSLNPAHRYINKILLTSGLLKDSSFISTMDKIFSSHRLINPEIFLVLEQTEDIRDAVNGAVTQKNDKINLDKAIQRKMVFDLVDEILVRKITSSRLSKEGKKQTSPEGLLKEVQLEIDRLCKTPDCNQEDETTRLLAADVNYQLEDWVDCSGEVPSVALDVERLIFKDLINEVITGELMDGRDWPNRHSRKLFGK